MSNYSSYYRKHSRRFDKPTNKLAFKRRIATKSCISDHKSGDMKQNKTGMSTSINSEVHISSIRGIYRTDEHINKFTFYGRKKKQFTPWHCRPTN